VARQQVTVAGPAISAPRARGFGGRAQTIVLLNERGDVATDDAETLRRILADHPQGQHGPTLPGSRRGAALGPDHGTRRTQGLPSQDLDGPGAARPFLHVQGGRDRLRKY
jgi:hypothetical protein